MASFFYKNPPSDHCPFPDFRIGSFYMESKRPKIPASLLVNVVTLRISPADTCSFAPLSINAF
jgi:hypothetical protein